MRTACGGGIHTRVPGDVAVFVHNGLNAEIQLAERLRKPPRPPRPEEQR